ncbi:HelD family protein [Dactylosporangium matsuzakiense]|uniref:DNA helicase n=1 Tax=Dactylosporangium matsuzakiense TaxID=53360 RepID=A0A9W6NPC5_9ACTN|nr:AAA family ATPase [Dactylosporangium matsuzakiense]UWZ43551.1 AAA family ATPase [Dactylosporangium matsuzakiense]GLL04121.1 DNA helicase [Dactylosporangium matsuzakiense]
MSDAVRDSEIAAEQAYLDRVYVRLDQLRVTAAEVEKAGYNMARVGNYGALVERDAMVYHAARRRRALESEHDGLVFGRLDLGPDGVSGADAAAVAPVVPGGEVRYVGRLGLRDEEYESLVVDWRAPAAAPFYRATPADRMGVVRRRSIRSTNEKVVSIEDDLLDPAAAPADLAVIGDGALLANLSRATGRGMKDIVATIQREQDDAIRSPASGITIVRGGPGTGKTAVALHRAAYLLYADRNRYESGGVLVVGPSDVFVGYVSRVLPSLGEDTATLRSLGQLVEGIQATRHEPPDVAAIKGSLRMQRVLSRAARGPVPNAPDKIRILYRGELLSLDKPALDELRRTVFNLGVKRNAARAKAAGHVLDALWRQSVQLLPSGRQQKREEFAPDIAERPEFVQFMRGWWPVLRPTEVLGWLGDRQRLQRWANGILSNREIALLASSIDAESLSGSAPGSGSRSAAASVSVSVEDVALLDELHEYLGDPPARKRAPRDPFMVAEGVHEVSTISERMAAARAQAIERPDDYRDYAHIIVDESQDVSPMQWRMVGRRGPHATWTIVGDPAQAAWNDAAESDRAMEAAVGTRRRSDFTLTTNYRNSAEIFAVAARVIRAAQPDIYLPTAVRSSGVDPVELTTSADELPGAVIAAAKTLLDQVEGTVGVITPTQRRAEVAAWLEGLDAARLQTVGALDSKGMEYDGVLVVEPAAIRDEAPTGFRTLYVALSRATQRLTTVGTQPF